MSAIPAAAIRGRRRRNGILHLRRRGRPRVDRNQLGGGPAGWPADRHCRHPRVGRGRQRRLRRFSARYRISRCRPGIRLGRWSLRRRAGRGRDLRIGRHVRARRLHRFPAPVADQMILPQRLAGGQPHADGGVVILRLLQGVAGLLRDRPKFSEAARRVGPDGRARVPAEGIDQGGDNFRVRFGVVSAVTPPRRPIAGPRPCRFSVV